jgi:hypothetical protein
LTGAAVTVRLMALHPPAVQPSAGCCPFTMPLIQRSFTIFDMRDSVLKRFFEKYLNF